MVPEYIIVFGLIARVKVDNAATTLLSDDSVKVIGWESILTYLLVGYTERDKPACVAIRLN